MYLKTLLLINLVLYSLSAFYSLFVFKYSSNVFIYSLINAIIVWGMFDFTK